MSTIENKAFVGRYLEAISGKEKTPELVNRFVADSDKELKEHIAFFEAAFPRYELIADEILAEDNKVMLRARFLGTHKRDFNGVAPTNKKVEIQLALIYEIDRGKIVRHWMLADQLGLMQQLGAIPKAA
jgi:predicted ester cyclase